MNMKMVDDMIKVSKVDYKTIRTILENKEDDETVLYFLDEYPLERLKSNRDIKKRILVKMTQLFNKYKKDHLGNIETVLEAAGKLFPKKIFEIIKIKSVKTYSQLFQLTIVDYCLNYIDQLYKKDILAFLKQNSSIRDPYVKITMLIIKYALERNEKVFHQIIEIAASYPDDYLLAGRVKNIQKDSKIFSKGEFLELKKVLSKKSDEPYRQLIKRVLG